jgi:hypothetical protein
VARPFGVRRLRSARLPVHANENEISRPQGSGAGATAT